jgi:acyl dehydratase
MLPEPGEELDLGRWVVGRDFVDDYLAAVEDTSPTYAELDAVPPMALAARALGALLKELALPPGTIHAAQELDFRRLVKAGQEVSCIASISKPMRRGEWQFVSAQFTLRSTGGEALMGGKSTVLVPVDQVADE